MHPQFRPNATDRKILELLPTDFDRLVRVLRWVAVDSIRHRVEKLHDRGYVQIDAAGVITGTNQLHDLELDVAGTAASPNADGAR